MGAWDELDIEISAENDTLELENLITELDDSEFADIFEPAKNIAEGFLQAIEDGTDAGLEIIASKISAVEKREIGDTDKHPYSQGILETSIDYEEQGNGYLIGTSINHIYPMSVEYGADIYPKKASVLRVHESQVIDWDGKPDEEGYFYFKEAHIPARPFVQPAYDEVVGLIENEGYGVFREVCKRMDSVTK